MNTELADLVAIVAHGTAWLAGATGTSPPDPLAETAAIRRSLRFDDGAGGGPASARDWLVALRDRGGARLWLVVHEGRAPMGAPPRMMAGFANAGRSAVVADLGGAAAEVWTADWQVGVKPGPGRTAIWDVVYSSTLVGPVGDELEPPDVGAAFDRLHAALVAAADFAASQDDTWVAQWAEVFREALAAGESDPSAQPFAGLLPERGFPDRARRLLAMAGRAWVFGGMGSWNDVVVSEEPGRTRYGEVSEELYQAVLHGIEAAANAFSPPQTPR